MTQERAELNERKELERMAGDRAFQLFCAAATPATFLQLIDRIDALENALRKVREWEADDHVRYCVFCRVGGYASSPAATHAPTCPRVTMPEVWETKQ